MTPIALRLLPWYAHYGRQTLPWQQSRTPYRVWLSEVMLQQTQVATVIPYFERFVSHFPHIEALATAHLDQVLHLWSGLGYYSRARNLHRAAQQLVAHHGGELPCDHQALQGLPGIGRSTAGAIMAQAFGEPYAILDGNVRRVLCRLHRVAGWPGSAAVQHQLWTLAERYTPSIAVADYTQAIMDLGALICTPRNPRCSECPLSSQCEAYRHNVIADYPERRQRQQIASRSMTLLMLTDAEGRLLLQRRPPAGIWGGLWSLPEYCELEAYSSEGGDNLTEWLATHFGLKALTTPQPQPMIHHRLTHLQLQITPLALTVAPVSEDRVMESDATLWYKTDTIGRVGLPVPVARILHDLPVTDLDEE